MIDATASLPDSAQAAARDSVGQVHAVAAQLPAPDAARLADAAGAAFTDALGIGFAVAATFGLAAAVLVWRKLPRRRATSERVRLAPEGSVA